jgi:predicted secreted protein
LAALAGIGASASGASTVINEASKWTLSIKNAVKDVTPFGASGNWQINLPTINSWTVKITAFVDGADTEQVNLLSLIGTAVALILKVDATHNFAGSGILTGIDPSVDVQGAETIDFSFTGTGAVAYT